MLFTQLGELREEIKADKEETSKELIEIREKEEEMKNVVLMNQEEMKKVIQINQEEMKKAVQNDHDEMKELVEKNREEEGKQVLLSHVIFAGAEKEKLRVDMREEMTSGLEGIKVELGSGRGLGLKLVDDFW